MGLLDIINGVGAGAQSGGCWRVAGKASACFGQAFTTPVTLTVNGVTSNFGFLQVIGGGSDNPTIDDWHCDLNGCVNLFYGCNATVAGCSCPSGECPDISSYRFNTDGCCCDLPCDGDFITRTYFHDLGYTISAATTAQFQIDSIIIDGTQYITSPVSFNPPNLISIGGNFYNTSFADTINSLGIPNLTAQYPTLSHIATAHGNVVNSSDRNNFVRLKMPDCLSVEIIYSRFTESYSMTETQTSFPSGSITLPYGYASSKLYDAVTTNEC